MPPVGLQDLGARPRPAHRSLLMFSHLHQLFDDAGRAVAARLACASSVGNAPGRLDGSSTRQAKSTARHAASGRRAHHRCSVLGWPWRMDFSRAASRLMASSGRATSMSFLR